MFFQNEDRLATSGDLGQSPNIVVSDDFTPALLMSASAEHTGSQNFAASNTILLEQRNLRLEQELHHARRDLREHESMHTKYRKLKTECK